MGNRHADNIGRNIIALQHPRETLGEFVARCDTLREYHETPGGRDSTPQPPPEPVQEPSAFQCTECMDTGQVAVLEGTRWATFDCPHCTEEPA